MKADCAFAQTAVRGVAPSLVGAFLCFTASAACAESALFRECWTGSYELQHHQHVSFGGGIMSKRNLIIEEGSVEAMARLQKQDEEFYEQLLRRAASVARLPPSPSHARTACLELYAAGLIMPL
jgi:hypothetical protein